MRREEEVGSYTWMLSHAVALDTTKSSTIYTKQNMPIVIDVFLMILCKAFSVQKSTNIQPDLVD